MIFGENQENPNLTRRLFELELNWTESLDQLDLLLDTQIPGLVTLCQDLNGASKLNKKYKMYELPIKDILPKHTQRVLQMREYSRLPQIYHNLSADPH